MSEDNAALFEKWRAGVPRVLELRLDDVGAR